MTGQAGDFAFDPDTRTLRGILLPFGEESRLSITGTEPISFDAEAITLPRDPSVVTLNRRHSKYDPVGRATVLEKQQHGVYAEFVIADTDEGDAYLRDERDTLRKLSPEVDGLTRNGARAVASRLTGAALVPEGAFRTAALFALGDIEDEHETETLTPDDAPTDDADTPTLEGEPDMNTIVPDGLAPAEKLALSLDRLAAAIARNDRDAMSDFAMADFALNTLQHSGPTTITIGADVQETGYLGELWLRQPYARRFVPLFKTAALTNWTMQGWQWDVLPTVADYTGNTAEVPTNAIDTKPVTINAARIAGGHRLDRRFRDFNDQSVITSYLQQQTEAYARFTDAKALAQVVAAATVTAPGAVPTGVAKGLAAIVDGALGIIATENRPSYAILSPELWRDVMLMKSIDMLEFLNAGFGLEEGDAAGFKIVPGAVGTGKVIVGAAEAFTWYELPGSPIRVDGLVPGNGAEDVAVYGYWAALVNNAAAIRSVTVA